MLSEKQLKGIFVPVVTPFHTTGELDLEAYATYIKAIAAHPVHGIVVNGTTGESPTVDVEEWQCLAKETQAALKGSNIPLVIGTGTNNTVSSVKRTEAAGNIGAEAVLVVVPYYNRPSQEGIIEHFRRVSEVGVPVIAYEIPGRTGVRMTLDTVRKVLDLPNVIGLKDCSGDTKLVTELVRTDSKPVLCGDDALFYQMLSSGASGGMLASANLRTDAFLQIYDSFREGRLADSEQAFESMLPLIRLLFQESNPAPIKWLLQRTGLLASDTLRLPMMSISEGLKAELEQCYFG